MSGTFELFADKAGEYRFRLKAGTGEIVLSSEGYTTKSAATNGAESVRNNCEDTACFVPLATEGGKFRFNMKAKNHQVIGTSPLYATEAARDDGIAAVARAAREAGIVDLTA